MTCIVGIESRGKVLLGADSRMQVDGQAPRDEDKLVRGYGFAIGFSGDGRSWDAIYGRKLPPFRGRDVRRWLTVDLCPWLWERFADYGIDQTDGAWSIDAIVAARGELWGLDDTLSTFRWRDTWGAIGTGAKYALGNLYATSMIRDARVRAEQALECAAAYAPADVAPPWTWATV